jgi:hypothetical protein
MSYLLYLKYTAPSNSASGDVLKRSRRIRRVCRIFIHQKQNLRRFYLGN